MIIWKQYIEGPGIRCYQLVGLRIPDVLSIVIQKLWVNDNAQWQFLLAIDV
jgi:hypothetical protein